MDDEFQEILDIINLVFIISFSIEMVIKLIGFGPGAYVSSVLNICDGATVIVGIVELGFSGSSSVTAVSVSLDSFPCANFCSL